MKTLQWTIWIVLLLMLGVVSVNASRKYKAASFTPLKFIIPPGFPVPNYTFTGNPLTEEGFQLGRRLFYDGRLSKDGNFACGACHQQFAAFATYDHNLSHGFDNQFTTRNAPALYNLVWKKEYHWDGSITSLEQQPLHPLTAPNEMGEDMKSVIAKIKSDTAYKRLFKATFGDDRITSQRMLQALAQFTGTLVSADAKYDRVKKGAASFTPEEARGYELFQSKKCNSCHAEPLFTDNSFRNTGIAVDTTINDYGRMMFTGKREDSLKFRVPSLRNVALTFPYGHDGRFISLGQALEHYNSGVQPGNNVDSLVRGRIPLSVNEKYYIQQFLRTLSDTAFVKNPRFATPQNYPSFPYIALPEHH